MPHYCYILYSPKLNEFYIGETEDYEARLKYHNTHHFKSSFTRKADDWETFHLIECENRTQARLIELHIKKMKSRRYLENLKKYPEMSEKLLERFIG